MYSRYCKLRDEKGVSDYQVAKSIGVNQAVFSDWRRGKSAPKTEKLVRIARFFGVSLDYLVTGEGPEMPADVSKPPPVALERPIEWEILNETKKANLDDLKAVLQILKRLNSYAENKKGD